MSTSKHDSMMIRHVPVTVGELAELAHEANALQADIVAEADAHRYTRDSLQSSNDARAVLVNELRKADEELADERRTCTAMEQTSLTLRAQLDVERAKHARATQHIARMVRGDGWPEGRPNPWYETVQADMALHSAERERLRAELDRAREGLASAHAAQGIAPLEFAVGDYVRLIAAHNDGVLDNVYLVAETAANSSLPYYLGDACQWVPASAVEAPEVVEQAEEPEPRPFKVGDRVRHASRGLGVIIADDNSSLPFLVNHDDPAWNSSQGGWWSSLSALQPAEWQPGERIEVGAEVEYVGQHPRTVTSRMIGTRATVFELVRQGGHDCATLHGHGGAYLIENLRRIS